MAAFTLSRRCAMAHGLLPALRSVGLVPVGGRLSNVVLS